MTRFAPLKPAALSALLLASSLAVPAQAAPVPKEAIDGYHKMCLDAVNMPKPYGEWDLKGNAKLPKYCDCFAPRFAERAIKAMKEMQDNPGKQPAGTLDQPNADELALRNSCRKEVGLPAALNPN